ncbi:LacI family transcriptional regulator [Caballeronia telluris]|uniref:LacI family transcriptional regulator n=1 Tax=Caballeronia telluris TaxID=326475 RepID=A0A158G8E0_9BURK|nr:LacI family transcriptional regulator [Caballeronia telluris]
MHAARYQGFCATLHDAGITHDGVTDGASPDPTAIFPTNDLRALGAMHAAADLVPNIPRDLSVIGITDIQLARESRPALSTVAVPTEVAATMAIKLLHALIDGSAVGAVRKRYP